MPHRDDIMNLINELNTNYEFKSPNEIEKFIQNNEITLKLLESIKNPLNNNFPNSRITLEVCDELEWTDDAKLLVNINVSEKMFFNGILNSFNQVYREIQPILDEYVSTIVLFPEIENIDLTDVKMNSNSAVNLLARTAYFNTYKNYEIEREITLREIPKKQQKEEIIDYVSNHDIIDSFEISDELRLDIDDIEEILDELRLNKVI